MAAGPFFIIHGGGKLLQSTDLDRLDLHAKFHVEKEIFRQFIQLFPADIRYEFAALIEILSPGTVLWWTIACHDCRLAARLCRGQRQNLAVAGCSITRHTFLMTSSWSVRLDLRYSAEMAAR